MLFWGRLPVIFLSLILGYFVFRFAKDLYGIKAGLFALFLYVFDANIIAHSRFITTDLGIAATLFIHLYFLYRFFKKPSTWGLIISGITFGIVVITKFSAALLLPIYFFLFIYLIFRSPFKIESKIKSSSSFVKFKKIIKRAGSYILIFGVIAFIGLLLTYLFYIPHVSKMSPEIQHKLIDEALPNLSSMRIVHKMVDIPLLRPLAHYLLGFQMVNAHVTGGHTVFFLGQVGNGWWYYYPVAFVLKTAIPLMIFIILTILLWKRLNVKDYFTEYYLWIPTLIFFAIAMRGSLNLGIRYLLPIYPFLFVFTSKLANLVDFKSIFGIFKRNLRFISLYSLLFTFLLIWYAIGSLKTYPFYLTYFNEFAGGSKGGVRYLTDSNLDWGQDLKRLAKYVEEKNIPDIKIDYFGGGNIYYYLGKKAIPWQGAKGKPQGWLAVSASIYSQGTVRGEYNWLKNQEPVDKIGHSIFVYKF